MKSEPLTWQLHNMVMLRKAAARIDFLIYTALAEDEDTLVDKILTSINSSKEIETFSQINKIDLSELKWFVKLIYRLIVASVKSNNKLLIQNYFEASGINRFQIGYQLEEIIFLLKKVNDEITGWLKQLEHLQNFTKEIFDFITLPIEFGIDEVEQQYRNFIFIPGNAEELKKEITTSQIKSSRELLEETIWSCLVNRK